MRIKHFTVALLISLPAQQIGADVNDTTTERRLSIPLASVAVTIPREDWTFDGEQRRPDDTAVYYMLSSERRQMFFSVYIDKTDVCRSADACLDTALKNSTYKEAQELQREEQGAFRLAKFYLDNPRGAPIKQAHVLASAYVDGIWIDVHISKAGKERPDLTPLLDFMKSVSVK